MGIFDRPLTEELTSAIHDVLDGKPATDAWLAFVRDRHPEALDVLARLALSEMAIDLLEKHGHLPSEQVVQERDDALYAAVESGISATVWEDVDEARAILNRVEALVAIPGESDVILLRRARNTRFADTA